MKKHIALILSVLIAVTAAASGFACPVYASQHKVKHIPLSIKPEMNSIELRWKKKTGVSGYMVYRKDVTKLLGKSETSVKLKHYTKIARLSGTENSFTDRRVSPGHYYAYVIKAFSKENGKNKTLYSSYISGALQYECPGLARPELLNGGNGEFYTNSLGGLYLYEQTTCGVEPTSVVVYRREKGEKNYTKIKVKRVEKDSLGMMKDSSVKPGKTYYYRIRTLRKFRGKQVRSELSDTLRIPNVNFTGRYTVKAISSGSSGDELVLKIKGNKYNGTLKFLSPLVYDGSSDGGDDIRIKEVSKDNKTWKAFKAGKSSIKAGETLYVKLEGKHVNSLDAFTFDEGAAAYDGSGAGYTAFSIDVKSGKGTACLNFD